jgi:hypothetical protein
MYAMSVNDVPGWLVTMTPSGMGVPLAWVPGLVPQCEALTVPADTDDVALAGLAAGVLDVDELLHPVIVSTVIAAARPVDLRIM